MSTEAAAELDPNVAPTFEQAMELAKQDAEAIEAAQEAENPPPKKEKPAAKAARERDEAGKFKPAEAKEEPAEEPEPKAAKEEKTEPAKEEPAQIPGGIAKARRLWNEGKIQDAVKFVFGVDADSVELNSKQWKAVKHEIKEGKAKATQLLNQAQQKENELRGIAREIEPLYKARVAFQDGNEEEAIKLAFGVSFKDFQDRLIAKVASGGKLDPKAEARLAALERGIQERDQRLAEQQRQLAQREQQEAEVRYQERLKSEVAECGEPKFERVATKPKFIQEIFRIKREYWDDSTKSTLPTIEAAEMAYEELYGGVLDEVSESEPEPPRRGKTNGVSTPRSGTSAKQPAKAGSSIRHTQAAEAAPEEDMSPDEILQYYIKKAKAEARNSA